MFGEAESWENLIHLTVLVVLTQVFSSSMFTATFAIIMNSFDKRISALHLTLLASFSNLTYQLHSIYTSVIIDYFGIFIPNIILCLISLLYALYEKKQFFNLEKLPREAWNISDEVLAKRTQVKEDNGEKKGV